MAGPCPALPHDQGHFRDELGHRRSVDGPFFRWRRRRAGAPACTPADHADQFPDAGVDVALWRALASDSDGRAPVVASNDGPLIPPGSTRTVEVWTETELGALHALGWLAVRSARPAWLERARAAARWHLVHTQPDNATNRPWAVGVFAHLHASEKTAEARLFAETLLHNCQITMGGADLLSRHILHDAADWLDAVGSLAPTGRVR
ncbi:MAG TPA: hypothetical protein DEB06_06705 [Phycisphaerales bacterium]|nr:hypothetical protein [Phycisphaerales bacterium]